MGYYCGAQGEMANIPSDDPIGRVARKVKVSEGLKIGEFCSREFEPPDYGIPRGLFHLYPSA